MKKRLLQIAALLLCAGFLSACEDSDSALSAVTVCMKDTDTQPPVSESDETVPETVPETAPAFPDEMYLDVENILQLPALPNGCEIVSLAIVLQYLLDTEIDPVWLCDHYLKQGPLGQVNPEFMYAGDPKGYGFGCYVPCLQMSACKYLLDADADEIIVKNISGSTIEDLEAWVARGWPVIFWATLNMEPSVVAQKWSFEGKEVSWYSGSHCVVLSGYTPDTSIVCDPLRGVVEYDRQDVIKAYELVGQRAMVLYVE